MYPCVPPDLRNATRPSYTAYSAGKSGMPHATAGSGCGRKRVTTVRVPPRWLAAANARAATQTPDPAMARPCGELSRKVLLTTWPVCGSMRVSVASNSSLTQTPPGPAAMAWGPSPTPMVAVTRPVAGSSLDTVRSSEFATHTAARVTAMPAGPAPT